jgi:hypothetical protein
MANFIKGKIAVSIFSIFVLGAIPLLEANFFRPFTINRWRELNWNDFQAIPKPFGKYDAEISSNIYCEYDSAMLTYHAYAGQNNMQSWVRGEEYKSDNLLKHEQYHFNISEYYARLLNLTIKNNPDRDPKFYRLHLDSLRELLNGMQDEYDSETDHNLKTDRQSMWEYKIDSLLNSDSGWVTDSLSGARVFFPDTASFNRGFSSAMVYRYYSLSKYHMNFDLTSFQALFSGPNVLDTVIEKHSKQVFKHISTQYFRNESGSVHAIVTSQDSSGHKRYVRWEYFNNVLFNVSAEFPINITDSTGYERMARSFLNSFQIIDTDSSLRQPRVLSKSSNGPKSKECFILSEVKKWGFTRGPLFNEDGSILIVFDPIRHEKDEIDHYLISRAKNKRSIYYGMSSDPIFFMPKYKIPNEPFWIDLGYFLKKDSINECAQFYRESILVDGINRTVLDRRVE